MSAFRRRAPAIALGTLVVAGQLGCRIYTLTPESAARLHDHGWTIRRAPETPAAPDAPAPTAIVPLRERPEIMAALQTPRDPFGVPTGLYALDPILAAHRYELDVRAANARASSNRFFILAGVWAAMAATFFATAPVVARHAESPRAAEGLFIAWGSLFGIEAIATSAVAASLRSDDDASALLRSFDETYKRPLP